MGEYVDPRAIGEDDTVETLRARVLRNHQYVTNRVDDDPARQVVVCSCGDSIALTGDQEQIDDWVEDHLSAQIRDFFKNTVFEGDPHTRRLR